MPPSQVLRAHGIQGALAALEALSGKELAQTTTAVVKKVTQTRGIPIVRAALKGAIKNEGSHRDKKGLKAKRGKSGPLAKNVTVRAIKKRPNEMVAMSIAPRAWYRHFFIGGTKPHVIAASDASGTRATSGQVRTINRLDAGYYRGNASEVNALAVGDRFYARVHHPGTAPHPVIDESTGRVALALQQELTVALLRKTAAAVRTANARSSARRSAKAAAGP